VTVRPCCWWDCAGCASIKTRTATLPESFHYARHREVNVLSSGKGTRTISRYLRYCHADDFTLLSQPWPFQSANFSPLFESRAITTKRCSFPLMPSYRSETCRGSYRIPWSRVALSIGQTLNGCTWCKPTTQSHLVFRLTAVTPPYPALHLSFSLRSSSVLKGG
jgi:hypothetical protein